MTPEEIVALGIQRITALTGGDFLVAGAYHEDTGAWTWTVTAKTEEPYGVSRQWVPTEGHSYPSQDDLDLMATEIKSTLDAHAASVPVDTTAT